MPGAFEQAPVALGLFLNFFFFLGLCAHGEFSQPIAQIIFSSKPVQKPGKSFPSNHQEVIQSLYSCEVYLFINFFAFKTSEMHVLK